MTGVSPTLTPRQQELVEAALRLLDKKGISGFTMRSFAQEVGLSPMAAYKHFENQRELVLEVYFAALRACHHRWRAVAATAPDDRPDLAFLRIVADFIRFGLEFPNRFELVFAHPFASETRQADDISPLGREFWEWLVGFVERAVESGAFRSDIPARELIAYAYAQGHGVAFLLITRRLQLTARVERDRLIRSAMQLVCDALRGRLSTPEEIDETLVIPVR